MNEVPVKLGTIVGYLLTALGAAATAWATAEGPTSHIKPGLLAVLTVVAGLLTSLGRMYQAKGTETPEKPAEATAALLAEAQKNAEGMPADGVQTAAIPFSGAKPA